MEQRRNVCKPSKILRQGGLMKPEPLKRFQPSQGRWMGKYHSLFEDNSRT